MDNFDSIIKIIELHQIQTMICDYSKLPKDSSQILKLPSDLKGCFKFIYPYMVISIIKSMQDPAFPDQVSKQIRPAQPFGKHGPPNFAYIFCSLRLLTEIFLCISLDLYVFVPMNMPNFPILIFLKLGKVLNMF